MKRFLVGLMALAPMAALAVPDWVSELPPSFRDRFLGVAAWQWIGLAALLGVQVIAYVLGKAVVGQYVRWRNANRHFMISDALRRSLRRAVGLILVGALGHGLLPALELPSVFNANGLRLYELVLILGFVLLAYSAWDLVGESVAIRSADVSTRAEKLLVPVTRKLVSFLILAGGFLMTLAVFGVNPAGLVAGLGLSGLIVALAAKDSVENIFGSLTILFDMPFALGDWVKIDKYEGVVEEINLRSTRIRTFEDSVITLPNSNLIKAAVENFGARRVRRQRNILRIPLKTEPEALDAFCVGLREFLIARPIVDATRVFVEAQEATDAGIGVLVQCFIEVDNQPDELRFRHEMFLEVLRLAQVHSVGVEPPAPPALPPA